MAHDDLDLPVGAVRLSNRGAVAGHNGLRVLINVLGSRDFGCASGSTIPATVSRSSTMSWGGPPRMRRVES